MTARTRDAELRRELLDRRDRDQDARHAYVATAERDWSPVAAVDADNLVFLAPLLERHGWLGSDLVDADGAHACWLLVQHAPPDRQDAWLPLMERAVADGTASARDLAYLRDRVDTHHDQPQTHGTQHTGYGDGPVRLWPVTDPDTLNQRRHAIGLPPVDAATIADAWTPAELAEHGHHLTDTTRPSPPPPTGWAPCRVGQLNSPAWTPAVNAAHSAGKAAAVWTRV